MKKRGFFTLRTASILEIFILFTFIFAIAFVMNGGLVRGATPKTFSTITQNGITYTYSGKTDREGNYIYYAPDNTLTLFSPDVHGDPIINNGITSTTPTKKTSSGSPSAVSTPTQAPPQPKSSAASAIGQAGTLISTYSLLKGGVKSTVSSSLYTFQVNGINYGVNSASKVFQQNAATGTWSATSKNMGSLGFKSQTLAGINGGTSWTKGTTGVNINDGTLTKISQNPTTHTWSKAKQPTSAGTGLLGANPFGVTGLFGHLLSGVIWGGIAAVAVELVGPMFGLSSQNTNALAAAAFAGVGVARFVDTQFNLGLGWSSVIGAGIGFAVFALLYKKTSTQTVTFQCLPYQPPIGGQKCELCNQNPYQPCTEYRCKALGQACELLNQGTTNQKCAWVNPHDVTAPTIQPTTSALSPKGLKYTPNTAINPPSRGVKIETTNGGCLQAFTPLEFGLTTNEPAQCKIDYNEGVNFTSMQFFVGGSNLFTYNHTEIMKLPSLNNLNTTDSPILKNGNTMNLYTKCMDANGNYNVADFVFTFCIDKSPDTTPPIIEGTSIPTGNPVQYGADNVSIDLYTNEPADCKWSRQDQAYDDMPNSMSCATDPSEINANLEYTCSGKLTGVQDRENNTFFFRCKDQPTAPEAKRNVNKQSYKLVLRGTQPLTISDVGPNETIKGGTSVIPVTLNVTTAHGADQGKAACYFSPTGEEGSYVLMANTASYKSSQELDLGNGQYTYYIKCIDAGGNTAATNTTFNVFVDNQAPTVTRIYKNIDALTLVTNENSQCVYSLTSCDYNFADGIAMLQDPNNQNMNSLKWQGDKNYYIKCADDIGNQPAPDQCSVIARPTDLGGDSDTTSS